MHQNYSVMKLSITILFMCISINVSAQLTFDTSKPIDTLIQDFVGNGVTVSNVTFTGGNQSIGSFNGSSSIGSSQGIVFTTGRIDSLIATPAATFLSTSCNLSGDQDLNAIVGSGLTYDAAVLEFDFVATNNTLLFDYVFASEEYNEFAGSAFNDVFAFFISGPGISGKQNIALLPSTSIPVSINNVNNGATGSGPCVNCSYYHDNYNDTTLAFDGFTTPLTATYSIVPGLTYHLKLAVADVADGIFDTGVFLQKYSLRSVSTTSIAETKPQLMEMYFRDDALYVDSKSSVFHVAVYNITGQRVFEAQSNHGLELFEMNIPSGVYAVVLETPETIVNRKIVKQ